MTARLYDMPSDNKLTKQIVCERGLYASQISPALRPGCLLSIPNRPIVLSSTTNPGPLSAGAPTATRAIFGVHRSELGPLYLGSTKVGATRTCAPRSATGCAPKGRSQVGHFLHCSRTTGRQPLQTRAWPHAKRTSRGASSQMMHTRASSAAAAASAFDDRVFLSVRRSYRQPAAARAPRTAPRWRCRS